MREVKMRAPTTWDALGPLLFSGMYLWIGLLLYSLVRMASYSAFYSKRFHRALKRRKASLVIKLYVWIGEKWRAGRSWLLKYQLPEVLVATYFGVPRFVYGSCICVLYVAQTYMEHIPRSFRIVQIIYGVAVGVNLLLSFAYTERPVSFVFSFYVIVDCLSTPSLLFSSQADWLNLTFLQAVPILHQWSVLEKHEIVLTNASTMMRLLVNLLFQLLTFFFVASCGIQFFELLDDPLASFTRSRFQITFANAAYAAVVTAMAIGYGDFVPYTLLGRMWIISHIVYAAYIITREISEFIGTVKSVHQGSGSFSKTSDTTHVVVTGLVKWQYLRQFFREFLAERENLGTKIVVLASSSEWPDNAWSNYVTHDPYYDHHLVYLEGSSLNPKDLERARVDTSSAVFLFADPRTSDPYRTDANTLKSLLTIRSYQSFVPIFAVSALAESALQFCIVAGLKPETEREDTQYEVHSEGPIFQRTLHSLASFWILSPRMRFLKERVASSGDDVATLESEPLLREGANEDSSIPPSFGWFGRRNSPPFSRVHQRRRKRIRRGAPETLCMQQIETAVLAESVLCNGLSTLLTNLLLRIAPVSHYQDKSWLLEYKVGAECTLHTMLLPKEFHGRHFVEVAPVLYDYGVVIIAIRGKNQWKIMKPQVKLESCLEAVVMTYHDQAVLGKIGELASEYFREHERGNDPNQDPHRRPLSAETPGSNPSGVVLGACSSDWLYVSDDDVQGSLGAERRTSLLSPESSSSAPRGPSSCARNPLLRHHVYSTGESQRPSSVTKDVFPGCPGTKRPRVYDDNGSLPRNLCDHVIVCLAGDSCLPRLRALATRIWCTKIRQKKQIPIVVIHSRYPKGYAREFEDCNVNGILFLMEGNSLQVDVLKKAQYQTARAIVIVSDGDKAAQPIGEPFETKIFESADRKRLQNHIRGNAALDSKAIFMVMTLDYLLGEHTETFLCCMLDAEESLQLLRAPKYARRKGFRHRGRRDAPIPSRRFGGSASVSRPSRSPSNTSLSSLLEYSPYLHAQTSLPVSIRIPRESSLSTGVSVRRSVSVRFDELGTNPKSLLDSTSPDGRLVEERGGKSLTAPRSREEFLERQRYASGELMISSLFTTLLVREYMTTGFISLIQDLIGVGKENPSSWIRLVPIPSDWIRDADTADGRTYRETFLRLLGMGCIALGLYRSGEAPVRLEVDSEAVGRNLEDAKHYQERVLESNKRQDEDYADGNELSVSLENSEPYIAYSASDESITSQRGAAGRQRRRPSFYEEMTSYLNDGAEFEEMYYMCPTTKRKILYEEGLNGENVLPYVYTNPEPYTLVAASDRLFLLCDPNLSIPEQW